MLNKNSLYEKKIQMLREDFGGEAVGGSITYEQLKLAHEYVMEMFTYVSDDQLYEKEDFWNTESFDTLINEGNLVGDCDDFGYAMIELLYKVLLIPKKNIYRVACLTETNEGHFVVWTQCSDGNYYQTENRTYIPKSVKHFRELGYRYDYYSPMTVVDKWFSAENRVAKIIYNTPNNLNSDKAKFSISKAFSVTKSKTLTSNWLQVVAGLTASIVSLVGAIDDISYTTLVISSVMLTVFGLIGVYLRTITDKDVEMKEGLDG